MSISGIEPGRPIPASSQYPDVVEPLDGMLASSTSTAAFTTNSVYLYRFRVEEPFPLASFDWLLGATSAGNVAFGVYTFDGTNYNRVAATADGGAGTINVVNNRAIASPPYLLVPRVDYWRAFGLTDGTLTILRLGIASAIGGASQRALVKASVYSAGLPSQISSPVGVNVIPWMALKSS